MLDRVQGQLLTLDSDAFADLYEAYVDAVFNYCLFRTVDEATAEELTADAFARAWAARARYRPERGEFAAWLFSIARRVVIDWQRHRNRHPILNLDPLTPDASEPPEALVEAGANQDRLRLLVQALPQAEQELIALKFGAGMNNREMGRLLHRSESAIGTALHRAMGKLRAQREVLDA